MARPLRVLNIMLARVRGGVESMALTYHQALSAQGFDVLSAGHPQGVLAERLPSSGFAAVKARFNLDPAAMLRLARLDRTFRPDLVLTHGNRAAGLALSKFMPTRTRTVCVLHNAFFKAHLKRCRAALCVSSSVLTAARAYMPEVDLRSMPNFARLETGAVRATKSATPVIAALGRLHEQKGFDVLLDAAARLRDAGQAFSLVIGGDGEEGPKLRAQMQRLGLERQVAFQGWIEDRAAFMAQADLALAPSRYEPFGLVVIEAMAAGVPVVVSDIEGPREILNEGRLGTLARPGDSQALAAAIQTALDRYPQACETAVAAQRVALETYGFEAGAARLAQAVRSLCAVGD
jgi:glycosyltransferase involved in cell wall biosynthesis